ncbi:MAG: cyclic nucleotide-binding domain-containing protein, partial [Xanthobacteraceae bacterium]
MHSTTSPTAPANSRHAVPSTSKPLQCLDVIAAIKRFRIRQEICCQGQAATTWYRVLAGAASCGIIRSDGRRQIVDLLFPG